MFSGLLTKDKNVMMQRIITMIVSAFLVVYAYEGFWSGTKNKMYLLGGLAGFSVILYFVLIKELYLELDTFLLTAFFSLGFISSIVAYGVSISFFTSRFFCAWMVFLALFYAMSYVKDKEKLLRVAGFAFSLAELSECIYVLFNATRSLTEEKGPLSESIGCFRNGRLCAVGNANLFGFICTSFLMVSVFGLLLSKGIMRIYYFVCIFVAWFCLGLTGCRTGAVGFSVSMGIILFTFGIKKFCVGKKDHVIIRYGTVFAAVLLVTALLIESFVFPSRIYHGLVKLVMGDDIFFKSRSIHDRNGTLVDRSYTWVATLKTLVRNPRRLFLGISSVSKELVWQVYEGHHELSQSHTHNVFLEIARSHGILGLAVWLILFVIWAGRCIRGLFNYELKPAFRYMAACAAGIMVMGLTEPVPFLYKSSWPLTMTFFVICGFYAGLKRSDK